MYHHSTKDDRNVRYGYRGKPVVMHTMGGDCSFVVFASFHKVGITIFGVRFEIDIIEYLVS